MEIERGDILIYKTAYDRNQMLVSSEFWYGTLRVGNTSDIQRFEVRTHYGATTYLSRSLLDEDLVFLYRIVV